jgi:hypothetical protein
MVVNKPFLREFFSLLPSWEGTVTLLSMDGDFIDISLLV